MRDEELGLMAMGRGLGLSSLSGFGVKQATYKLLQCGERVFLYLLLDLDGYINLGHVLALVLMEKLGVLNVGSR